MRLSNLLRKRICVIGCGPAGMVSAKVAMDDGHEVMVFEKTGFVGGTWADTSSNMYRGMVTNSPRQMMEMQGAPFCNSLPTFLQRKHVYDYLLDYQKNMKIPVELKTKVTKIQRSGDKWQVFFKTKRNELVEQFDAVFVCNGHFRYPRKLMEHERFEGSVVHSQMFKDAELYKGKSVAVIGSSASGIDIAQLIAQYAKQVYLIGPTAKYKGLKWNIKQVTQLVKSLGSHSLTLNDGSIINDVDDIIFAIGFEYKFPFLPKGLVNVNQGGGKCTPIYEHVLHKDYPDSLFFIGLNNAVAHFPLNEVQARYACAVIDKKAKLPTKEDYDQWHTAECIGKSENEFHNLGNLQWPYMENLAKMGNFEHWFKYKLMEKVFFFTVIGRESRTNDYKKSELELIQGVDDFHAKWPKVQPKLKIAIIGSGPAGLISARLALDDNHNVTVFESRGNSGGLWNTKMFDGMKTDTAKELMRFQGYEFDEDLNSYIEPVDVFNYLQRFGSNIPIQYYTRVQRVERTAGLWQIVAQQMGKRERSVEYFDAVFVCNGHFSSSKPLMDYKKFKGTVIHSKSYRKAEPYSNRKVLIIGSGPSGIEIALQIAEKAEKVCLSGETAKKLRNLPPNVIQIQHNVKEIGIDDVTFNNGEKLENVEDIIFATGYVYQLPFFAKDIIQVSNSGKRISPLYEHVLHRDYPDSLFFIGLNCGAAHLPLSEQQARFALEIATKRADLPDKEELKQWDQKRFDEVKDEADFHVIGNKQWNYMEKLSEKGKFEYWPDYKIMERIHKHSIQSKFVDVVNYKKINYTLTDNEDGFVPQLPEKVSWTWE